MKRDNTPRPKRLADRPHTLQATPDRPGHADFLAVLREHRRIEAAEMGFLRRQAKRLRESWFVVGLEAIGLIGLVVAAGLFVVELRERQDERTARAWQLVTTPAPGNSGKIEALEYLNSQTLCLPKHWYLPFYGRCWKARTSLTGIDLSAKTHGEVVFLRLVDLSGADLSRANLAGADLTGANLSCSNLWDANLSGAILWDANLFSVSLISANLAAAKLWGTNLSNVSIWNANLSGASLSGTNLSGASLFGANLSGTLLSNVITNDKTSMHSVWAYKDTRPIALPKQFKDPIAYRNTEEPWDDFVERIRKERPSLNFYYSNPLQRHPHTALPGAGNAACSANSPSIHAKTRT